MRRPEFRGASVCLRVLGVLPPGSSYLRGGFESHGGLRRDILMDVDAIFLQQVLFLGALIRSL